MALWFFRRSGSRVSIHNPVTAESVLRAPPVSGLTLCPLGQPEKAAGHESQIEPWLASTTTLLACARKLESVVAIKKMNCCGEKTPRASQHDIGWKAQQTFSLLPVAGEIFLLTSPFIERGYRKSLEYQFVIQKSARFL